MFEWVIRNTKIAALKWGLKRKAPSKFSYSPETNYFSSVLANESISQEVLLTAIDRDSFSGLAFDGNRFNTEISYPIKDIDSWKLEVVRFYGHNRITYSSLKDFLISELTFLPQRLYIKEWMSQRFYNFRTRFRHDRMEILRNMIESHLKDAQKDNGLLFRGNTKSVVDLLSEVYGNRVYAHPNYEKESARFRLILDSLAETGELEKRDMHEFKLNASAVASLSTFELE